MFFRWKLGTRSHVPLNMVRRRLWLATGMLVSALPLVWIFGWPSGPAGLDAVSATSDSVSTAEPSIKARSDHTPQVSIVWQPRPLRQPLFDPVPVVTPPPPPPPLRLAVLGTVVEAQNTSVLLRRSNGQLTQHASGETVEGARIERIRHDGIEVTYHGQSLTLTPE